MSLSFNRIFGKHPRNDALSVVKGNQVVDILPLSDLREKGITAERLTGAFLKAHQETSVPDSVRAIRARARLELGLG